jgi:catechol 2,3-dioxygenase-like lactoylglutathione lyase family enzyme
MDNIGVERFIVVCLWAEDVQAIAHFYKDVLGLELHHDAHHQRLHFKVGDVYLTILKGKPQAALDMDPARFPIFAFKVEDLDAAVEQLRTHHVEMPWGIEGEGNNRWVMFHDPAGNLIEIT